MLKKIALVIGILAVIVIVWGLFFGGDGVMAMAWNGVAGILNDLWTTISGSSEDIVPTFETADDNGSTGLNIDSIGGGGGGKEE